jgi:gas vesicle protein
MFHSHRSMKDFLLGVAIGGSLGAIMFNTKKGKEVQKDIMNKYHMMSKKAQHLMHDGLEKIGVHASSKRTTKRTTKRKTKKKKR